VSPASVFFNPKRHKCAQLCSSSDYIEVIDVVDCGFVVTTMKKLLKISIRIHVTVLGYTQNERLRGSSSFIE